MGQDGKIRDSIRGPVGHGFFPAVWDRAAYRRPDAGKHGIYGYCGFPGRHCFNVPDIDTENSELPPWRDEIDGESGGDEFYGESEEGY